MKYYLSILSVIQGEGDGSEFGLICAENQKQADKLNAERASMWGGDDGYEHGPGEWSFEMGNEQSALVSAVSTQEISYVTFCEMRTALPVFGDAPTGDLSEESSSEQVKTLARRMGSNLTRMGTKVAHGQMLNAVAASLGETDWAVLQAKQTPVPAVAGATGMFCPGCGKQGTVVRESSAFVEQGPSNKDGYMFEGHADHYGCSACGHQFLDWTSDWPKFDADPTFIILMTWTMSEWRAKLYPCGPVLAALSNGHKSVPSYEACEDAVSLATKVGLVVMFGRDNKDLELFLADFEIDAQYRASGESRKDAVQRLLALLPENVLAYVLNKDVGHA